MAFFRRNLPHVNDDLDPSLLLQPGFGVGDRSEPLSSPSNPFDAFLDEVEPLVDAYRDSYSAVGEVGTRIQEDPKLHRLAADSVEQRYGDGRFEQKLALGTRKIRRQPLSSEELIDNYFVNLPTMMIYVFKGVTAETGVEIKTGYDIAKKMAVGNDLADGITTAIAPTLAMRHWFDLIDVLTQASAAETAILDSFISKAEDDHRFIGGFGLDSSADEDDSERRDQVLCELQDVFVADLMRGDDSRLKAFVANLANSPERFAQEFVENAEIEGSKSRLSKIGAIAVATLEANGVKTDFQTAVLSIRDRWSDLDSEILSEYGLFVNRRIREINKQIHIVAGISEGQRRRGIRFPVLESDVERVRSMFSNLAPAEFQRKHGRAERTQNVVTPEEMHHELETGGGESCEIMTIKNGVLILLSDETQLEKIAADYAGNNDSVHRDVIKMIRAIARGPYHTSNTVKLTGVNRWELNGREYPLREYSPQRGIFSLEGGKASRRTRIVYSVIPGTKSNGRSTNTSVVIIEVLHHDEFSRKYSR